jgi:hypothetical protein
LLDCGFARADLPSGGLYDRAKRFDRSRSLKWGMGGADVYDMAVQRAWEDTDGLSIRQGLLAEYRCSMCHKQCQVPCQFTVAEFRQMEQAMRFNDETTND